MMYGKVIVAVALAGCAAWFFAGASLRTAEPAPAAAGAERSAAVPDGPVQVAQKQPATGSAGAAPGPYKVVDGNRVDINTLQGWRTWRALACERCHGPNQEGLVGPSLIASMKVMNKEQFKKAVLMGAPDKGMPSMNTSKQAVDNIDNLYAYLKGRSDGAINPGRLEELK